MAPLLELLALSERAMPGRFLLTDVHSTNNMLLDEMEAYWPALVLDEFLAPSRVEQGQQYPLVSINNDDYLIWLIGKRRFFWVTQGHLYQPQVSQLDALEVSVSKEEFKEEFKSIFQIGMNNDAAEILEIFQDQIVEDVTRINGGESILPSKGGGGIEACGRGVKRPFDNPPLGRNLRAGSGMSSLQSSSSAESTRNSLLPGTPSTQATQEEDPAVKQELNDDDLLPRKEKVRILVGSRNTEFTCSKVNIAKSPVLSAYLVERAGEQSFIMHPDLKDIDPKDFKYVVDFLRTGAYLPGLINAPASRSDPRKFVVEGLCRSDALDEIQRCGRLHVMARTFQIPTMVDYIFQRLTQVRHSTVVLDGAVLLQLTNTIFGRSTESESLSAVPGDQVAVQEDALEGWLITRIVESLEMITTWANTSQLFWVVMHAGKGRNLSAKIFERRGELDRRLPGFIKIEDD